MVKSEDDAGGDGECGQAVQVISTSEEHTFILNEDELSEVLMRDEIKDRFVCLVSVAGAFRKGKSFLLDFFLRYMYSQVNQLFPIRDLKSSN